MTNEDEVVVLVSEQSRVFFFVRPEI